MPVPGMGLKTKGVNNYYWKIQNNSWNITTSVFHFFLSPFSIKSVTCQFELLVRVVHIMPA